MEAKVDVRKLQLLNDRIIQTLEALNQVRASVHGIGQGHPYGVPNGPMGQPQQPFGAWTQPGIGHSSSIQGAYLPFAAPPAYVGSPLGLSHTSYPMGVTQSGIGWPMQQPFAQQPFAQQPFAQQPFAQQPFAQPHPQYAAQWSPYATMGLSHSGIDEVDRRIAEQRASDLGRVLHTFPFGAYV